MWKVVLSEARLIDVIRFSSAALARVSVVRGDSLYRKPDEPVSPILLFFRPSKARDLLPKSRPKIGSQHTALALLCRSLASAHRELEVRLALDRIRPVRVPIERRDDVTIFVGHNGSGDYEPQQFMDNFHKDS